MIVAAIAATSGCDRVTGPERHRARTGRACSARVRYAKLARMLSVVLVLSGLFATVYGMSRGYVAARGALLPLLREGEPTRTLIDAGRPIHARSRVRVALRQVVVAVAWLTVALYGMYLATVGAAMAG